MFTVIAPTLDNQWRSIILFGRNVASYKFALAKSLIELADQGKSEISIEELSVPFSRHITEHLKLADKQGTSGSSKFLDACRKYNAGGMDDAELVSTTAKLGFVNVIDAFHIVNSGEIPVRFFESNKNQTRLQLTDSLHSLKALPQFANLQLEVESRWRLVETAWELNLSKNLVQVEYEPDNGLLVTPASYRRVAITSSRDALNGYQKGKCFYCFDDIRIDRGAVNADVDHFFPHCLRPHGMKDINGVWNLVLACETCNRGEAGKFARVPELRFLERLATRNSFLINSHHPLRETLISQTGASEEARTQFLNGYYNEALALLIHTWRPAFELAAAF